MRATLHLISLPMVYPLQPSGPLGCLEAYVRERFGMRISAMAYSAYWDVLFAFKGADLVDFYLKYRFLAEDLFFLLCVAAFSPEGTSLAALLARFNSAHSTKVTLDENDFCGLQNAMSQWIERKLVPHLDPEGLNIVGFSTTFAQLFASIFVARHLRSLHDRLPIAFVFGGASVTAPEAATALQRWGVDGYIVDGPGERPLEEMIECVLAAPDSSMAQDGIDKLGGPIRKIGQARRPEPFDVGRGTLEFFPLPNYDEYFATLRQSCADSDAFQQFVERHVALPLEGSRGCFAKCDFCQIPALTTHFRTRKGDDVAARAMALADRYCKDEIVFADAVCNTWAEAYADRLIAANRPIAAFMEMRAHQPERFWTKLALSGVTDMQIGVEAVSSPLLKAMSKGTTVIQNLRAVKYLAELGLRSLSNLITYHPKSTVADVAETQRILTLTPHFPPFALSTFTISYASPIYNRLTEEERAALQRSFSWLPKQFQDWSFLHDLAYPFPLEWLQPDVRVAWSEFHTWHEARPADDGALRVERHGAGLLHFSDTRGGHCRVMELSDDEESLYTFLHQGLTAPQAAAASGLPPERVNALLANLTHEGLLIEIEGYYLSLALRPRSELVANLLGEANIP
jgi:radical SAM superfamily enzyme YgiQ (UPF0313 family)